MERGVPAFYLCQRKQWWVTLPPLRCVLSHCVCCTAVCSDVRVASCHYVTHPLYCVAEPFCVTTSCCAAMHALRTVCVVSCRSATCALHYAAQCCVCCFLSHCDTCTTLCCTALCVVSCCTATRALHCVVQRCVCYVLSRCDACTALSCVQCVCCYAMCGLHCGAQCCALAHLDTTDLGSHALCTVSCRIWLWLCVLVHTPRTLLCTVQSSSVPRPGNCVGAQFPCHCENECQTTPPLQKVIQTQHIFTMAEKPAWFALPLVRVCGFAGLRVCGFAGLRVCGFAGYP